MSDKDRVKVDLTAPKHMKLDIPITVNGRTNAGEFHQYRSAHAVIFAPGSLVDGNC